MKKWIFSAIILMASVATFAQEANDYRPLTTGDLY